MFDKIKQNLRIKQDRKVVDEINSIDLSKKSNQELKAMANELKKEAKTKTIGELSTKAFALVKEASKRSLGLTPYDVQLIGGLELAKGNIIEQATGEGKAHPLDQKIPTPTGFKRLGDLKLNDKIYDRLGNLTTITAFYPQGEKEVYKVELIDGRVIECADEHLWTVKTDNNEIKTFNTDYLYKEQYAKDNKYKFYLPANAPIEYKEDIVFNYGLKKFSLFLLGKENELNQDEINYFNTITKNKKYLPMKLKHSKVLDRLALFRFLGIKDLNEFKLKSTNIYILKELQTILYSLGYIATIKRLNKDYYCLETKKVDFIPIKRVYKTGKRKEQVCIKVDNPEHLYLVGDFVVTHNTLTAAAPAFLLALYGKVHVVTVNDYLAKRDRDEMGKIYEFLGLDVSFIHPKQSILEKKRAYQADIIYGTANTFGFDYLKDNLAKSTNTQVQTALDAVIIDEVDNILIDDAKTPLIISSDENEDIENFKLANKVALSLKRGKDIKEQTKFDKIESSLDEEKEDNTDFHLDKKNQNVIFSDKGIKKAEKLFGIDDFSNHVYLYHLLKQAIHANYLMERDVDYLVKDDQIIIIDKSTGRLMDKRRFSDGLHQALEAKEGVSIKGQSKTVATITLQNYFRMYKQLSGMTGTALSSKDEFKSTYGVDTYYIPLNKEMIRKDYPTEIYLDKEAKLKRVIELTKKAHSKGQPVLIGTTSVESSEKISKALRKEGLKHNVLNAKYEEKEAYIIAQAGRLNAITVATNMAGRGTDILLGGNPETKAKEEMLKQGFSKEEIVIATSLLEPTNNEEKELKELYKDLLKKAKIDYKDNREKVMQAGGLLLIGTEKHESERIDKQLRGRSGRQGEPGESIFVISFEDDLLSIRGSDRLLNMAKELVEDEDTKLIAKGGPLLKQVDKIQKSTENQSYQIRKNILEFDDVDSIQRDSIYSLRQDILEENNLEDISLDFIDLGSLNIEETLTGFDLSLLNKVKDDNKTSYTKEEIKALVLDKIKEIKENTDSKDLEQLIKQVLLNIIDIEWQRYLVYLDNLSTAVNMNIGVDPIENYKDLSFKKYNELLKNIASDFVLTLLQIQVLDKTA